MEPSSVCSGGCMGKSFWTELADMGGRLVDVVDLVINGRFPRVDNLERPLLKMFVSVDMLLGLEAVEEGELV